MKLFDKKSQANGYYQQLTSFTLVFCLHIKLPKSVVLIRYFNIMNSCAFKNDNVKK